MSLRDILIQLIGIVGTALFFLSYQFKKNKNVFQFQFISYCLYTIHFILLDALTGGLSCFINSFRCFFLVGKWKFGHSKWACIILCLLQCATLLFTWNGWLCILPVIANVASTIAAYTHNPQKIRAAGLFINSPLWLTYDILVLSIAGILDEVITILSILVSIFRYGWKNLDKKENI